MWGLGWQVGDQGRLWLQFWGVRGLILERVLVFETLPDRKVLEVMRFPRRIWAYLTTK